MTLIRTLTTVIDLDLDLETDLPLGLYQKVISHLQRRKRRLVVQKAVQKKGEVQLPTKRKDKAKSKSRKRQTEEADIDDLDLDAEANRETDSTCSVQMIKILL